MPNVFAISPSLAKAASPRSSFGSVTGLRLHASDFRLVRIANLQFPFSLHIRVTEGLCDVQTRGFQRHLKCGDIRKLPAYESMGLLLFPGSRLELERDLVESRTTHNPEIHLPLVADDVGSRRPLASKLSEMIFIAPNLDWRLETAGGMLSLGPSALSRRLMKEGESLREILRRQRLARYAFDLLAGVASSNALAYGFPDMCRLENAIFERFGVSVNQLEALMDGRSSHHPVSFPHRKVA